MELVAKKSTVEMWEEYGKCKMVVERMRLRTDVTYTTRWKSKIQSCSLDDGNEKW